MKYKSTTASTTGRQTLWQCAYCGSVICSTRNKPQPHCPCCDTVTTWLRQELPIAMFDIDDN